MSPTFVVLETLEASGHCTISLHTGAGFAQVARCHRASAWNMAGVAVEAQQNCY